MIGLFCSEGDEDSPCTDPSETEVLKEEGESEGVELDTVKPSS